MTCHVSNVNYPLDFSGLHLVL